MKGILDIHFQPSDWATTYPTNMIIIASLQSYSITMRTSHSNLIPLPFWCRSIVWDMTIILRLNDLKQNYFAFFGRFILERRGTKKGLVRGNDRNAAGTTHSVWGRRIERWRRRAERSRTHSHSSFRSCRSVLVPRSRVVPNHSRTKWDFRTMPEQGRSEEGGWRHSTIVLIHPKMPKAMSILRKHKWPQNDEESHSSIVFSRSIVPESFKLV